MDVCERCGFPAVQDAAGNWGHAQMADAVFCAIVMATLPGAGDDYCGCCGAPGTEQPAGEHLACCGDLHDVEVPRA